MLSFSVKCPIVKTFSLVLIRYNDASITLQGIDKYHQNGVIRSYTLEIRTGGSLMRYPELSNKTFQHTVSLLNNETHSVSVTGKTSAGESPPGNTILSICKYFT